MILNPDKLRSVCTLVHLPHTPVSECKCVCTFKHKKDTQIYKNLLLLFHFIICQILLNILDSKQ